MKILNLVLFVTFLIQDQIPYKPSEEFDLKMNFEFKDRSAGRDPNKIDMDLSPKEYQKKNGTGVLPYLYLNLKVLTQQANEVRIKVTENGGKNVFNKKFDPSTVIKLELGFTDDIKDRVGPYEYTVVFLNEDKDPVSRIVIYFEKDGTYLVNGQNRGKI
jgi:hypothetical protein